MIDETQTMAEPPSPIRQFTLPGKTGKTGKKATRTPEVKPQPETKPQAKRQAKPQAEPVLRLDIARPDLAAQTALLHDEDEHQLRVFCDALWHELQPVGFLEEELLDRIALIMWRLKRTARIEAGILSFRHHAALRNLACRDILGKEKLPPSGIRRFGVNYHIPPSEAERKDAEARERAAEIALNSDLDCLGRAFVHGIKGDAFANLSRYEAGLERTLAQAMQQFHDLQDKRKAP